MRWADPQSLLMLGYLLHAKVDEGAVSDIFFTIYCVNWRR